MPAGNTAYDNFSKERKKENLASLRVPSSCHQRFMRYLVMIATFLRNQPTHTHFPKDFANNFKQNCQK